jgi:putative membrane protein
VLANFGSYLLFYAVDIVLLVAAGIAYIWVTPYNELVMIREGNTSAAVALAGAMLGYAFVVYTVTIHATTVWQVIVWSVISLIVQIAAFEFCQFVALRDLKARIEHDDLAHGVTLGIFSLVAGVLNAACLTP